MSMHTSITLGQIIDLIGKLDDSSGEDTARERFRRFLTKNVKEIGQIRDYVEECLRNAGTQYNHALQDLVNHIGGFLGFDVSFGRYQGVPGQPARGFDGYWKSPAEFNIIVEVKTSETYAIKTATLIGYIDALISEKRIPNWDNALGLYVVGRPDPEINQLENAIIAEKRIHQLRIISVDSLLSLAEIMNDYDVDHDDILAVLRPSGPKVDPVIELMKRLIVQPPPEAPPKEKEPPVETDDEVHYWLTPVKSDESQKGEEVIKTLVFQEQIYAFGERTPGRKLLKPGDWIVFYASGIGVIAHARVVSYPEKKPHPKIRHPEKYPWTFHVEDAKLYLDNPVIINLSIRSQLDAFKSGDPNKPWGWFVQSTRNISKHDYKILTN